MYVEDIHVLEFKSLLLSINEKEGYNFNMEKPSKRQLEILCNHALRVTENMVAQLGEMVKIIGCSTGKIFFTMDDDPISIESDYTFTITNYEKGLYGGTRSYVLWSKTDGLRTCGCITRRRDVSEACKKYFLSRVAEILSIDGEKYDIENAQPSDFIFHSRVKGDSILTEGGRRSYDLSVSVDKESYKKYVEKRIDMLL